MIVGLVWVAAVQTFKLRRLASRVRALENPPTFRHGTPIFKPTKPSLN